MPNLTKRILDAAKPQPGDYFLWCSATPGFAARVYPSGRKMFVAQVRVGRAQRRVKIGPYGPFTVEQARKRAEEIVKAASEGRDPQRERKDTKAAVTVAELCEEYMTAARAGLVMTRFRRPKRPATVAIDEGRISRHIKPLIGRLVARDLTRGDVQRMADDIAKGATAGVFKGKPRGRANVSGGTGTAARVVELLGGIFTWAEKRDLVSGANPTRGVETARSDAKDRVLTAAELKSLGTVLKEQEAASPAAVAAVRLIALTGTRREEACGLRWTEVDEAGHCLRLEQTKTGRSMRPIGEPALAVLCSVTRSSETWVFPNRNDSGSAALKKSIAELFDKAGLTDARAHDLRRTFGSAADALGYSEATIGELLGHARRGVTARHYIRRPDAALIAAADRIAEHIAAAMDGKASATNVIDLHARTE